MILGIRLSIPSHPHLLLAGCFAVESLGYSKSSYKAYGLENKRRVRARRGLGPPRVQVIA